MRCNSVHTLHTHTHSTRNISSRNSMISFLLRIFPLLCIANLIGLFSLFSCVFNLHRLILVLPANIHSLFGFRFLQLLLLVMLGGFGSVYSPCHLADNVYFKRQKTPWIEYQYILCDEDDDDVGGVESENGHNEGRQIWWEWKLTKDVEVLYRNVIILLYSDNMSTQIHIIETQTSTQNHAIFVIFSLFWACFWRLLHTYTTH